MPRRTMRKNAYETGRSAIAALMMSTAAATLPVLIATPAGAQQNQVQQFSIPAGNLTGALAQFGSQSGLQVTYLSSDAAGKSSVGFSGSATSEQALQQLLSGSGLGFGFTDQRTVAIAPQAAATMAPGDGAIVLDTVMITAGTGNSTMVRSGEYAGGQVAMGSQLGMLGNRDVMDTPFSQTGYTHTAIQNQQALTVHEVVANDPSVVINTTSGGNSDESNTIRGFQDRSWNGSSSLNGLAGMSPLNSPDMAYIERVEVLRGPSALLNGVAAGGSGGIGGAVGLQTKQAGDEPLTQLTARYESRAELGAHLDISRRFGQAGQFGLRFNAALRDGDGPVDPQSGRVGALALNLDYRGKRLRLSADVAHQTNDSNPMNFQTLVISGVGVVPDAPDAETSLNPSWGEHSSRLTLGMVRGEFDVTDALTAYAAIGKQEYDLAVRTAFIPRLLDRDGTYNWYNLQDYENSFKVLSVQAGLRGNASTGSVDHDFGLNLSRSRMESGGNGQSIPYDWTTNIYDPVFGPRPTFGDPANATSWKGEQVMSGIALADTLSALDGRLMVTAGLRYQKVENLSSRYESDAWTPAFAVVFKPRDNLSVYANYIQALQPGQIVGTTYANAGDVLSPFISEQYEAGVKMDWGSLTTTLAAFQITRSTAMTIQDPAGGLPTLADNGRQRNRGLELNAYGELRDDLRLMGGVTLMDARLARTMNGAQDGFRPYGVPKFRAVIGGEWDTPFVDGLTLTGRISHTGKQIALTSIQDLYIPSWTTLDLGARYTVPSDWAANPVTVRLNVDNVLGKDYWATGTGGDALSLGAPRTVRLSATVDF